MMPAVQSGNFCAMAAMNFAKQFTQVVMLRSGFFLACVTSKPGRTTNFSVSASAVSHSGSVHGLNSPISTYSHLIIRSYISFGIAPRPSPSHSCVVCICAYERSCELKIAIRDDICFAARTSGVSFPSPPSLGVPPCQMALTLLLHLLGQV